jgi:hypothetical protein
MKALTTSLTLLFAGVVAGFAAGRQLTGQHAPAGTPALAPAGELARTIADRQRASVSALSAAFGKEPPDLPGAETALGELRYHRRFLDEVGSIEDEMG